MIAPIDIQSPPEDLNQSLEIAMPELQALAPELYVRRIVSRARVLELTRTLVHGWGPLADEIEHQLSPLVAKQRGLELGRIRTRAWLFYKTDLDSVEIGANTLAKQRRELGRAVAAHDHVLYKWASPAFGDHPEHAETLRDISRGIGARDDAEDVLRLVQLFRSNWSQVVALQLHHVVNPAYLDKAMADATKQLDMLTHGVVNPARKLADAAYSLWYRDYNELMHLGRYLCRGEADATLRFPGVREPITRSGEVGEVGVEDGDAAEGEGESPQPAEDPTVAA